MYVWHLKNVEISRPGSKTYKVKYIDSSFGKLNESAIKI